MIQFNNILDPKIATLLKEGCVGVLRTDTLYGIVARADDEHAVEKVYNLKLRTPTKSPIILIASHDQMYEDDIVFRSTLDTFWPGKVSAILPSSNAPLWIRRKNNSVAYRMPDDKKLTDLVAQTGPLIAPSANIEGKPPARDIAEAIAYFGEGVDFYVEGGRVLDDSPSQLLKFKGDGTWDKLR
jgi:L-threonylcarbamoyladenylate synthase